MPEKRVSEYISDHKEEQTPLAEVKKRRQNAKLQQIEELELDAYIAKAKKELREAQSSPSGVQPEQTKSMVASILAGRKPEEIKQILTALGPEEIQKLALVSAAQSNSQTALMMRLIEKPGTSVKDTIELIQTVIKMREPKGSGDSNIKEMVEVFRVGLEAGKGNQPAQSQSKESAMELAMKYMKPLYDTMAQKDKEIYAERIANLESRIVDPIQYLERIKEVAPSLGLVPIGQGGKANLDFEREKLGLEKWKIEQEWLREDRMQELGLKRQDQKEKYKLIENIVGRALKSEVVKDAVNKLSARASKQATSKPAVTTKDMANKFLCPSCLNEGKQILIDATGMPDSVTCPECKKVFENQEKKSR